jgi:hypothetical protein
MTWTAPSPAPVTGPTSGDERPMLEAYLRWQRTALLDISAGLTGDQLAARAAPPSTLSLLGLIRHMAKVERIWFRQRVAGQEVPALHGGPGSPVDFDPSGFADAAQEIAALQEEWRQADQAVGAIPLDHTFVVTDGTWSLRMVYLHMIGEYARHNGHADLLRENVDGVTGR